MSSLVKSVFASTAISVTTDEIKAAPHYDAQPANGREKKLTSSLLTPVLPQPVGMAH